MARGKKKDTIPGMGSPPAQQSPPKASQGVSAAVKASQGVSAAVKATPPEPQRPEGQFAPPISEEARVAPKVSAKVSAAPATFATQPAKASALKDPRTEEQVAPKELVVANAVTKVAVKSAVTKAKSTATKKAAAPAQQKAEMPPPTQAQKAAPTTKAVTAKSPSVKKQAKSAAAPTSKELVQPDDVVEAHEAGIGMETVKKRRRRKKEELTGPEAEANDGHEEMCESTRLDAMHRQHYAVLSEGVVKDLAMLPEIRRVSGITPGEAFQQVAEQRKTLESIVSRVDDLLKNEKMPRPKIIDTRKLLLQFQEIEQCKVDGSLTQDTKQAMLADKRIDLGKANRWEAYCKFQEELNNIRQQCAKRLVENEVVAKQVKLGSEKKRVVIRVANVMGVKVDELDESSVVSKTVELPAEVTALSFLYKNKFEKQYCVVIDRADGRRTQGVPLAPPKAFTVHGKTDEASACVSALKALDLKRREVIPFTSKQEGLVSRRINPRKLEQDFAGVFVQSDRTSVTLYGPTKTVAECKKRIIATMEEEIPTKASATERQRPPPSSPLITLDKDKARALKGPNGKVVQKIQADSGAVVKVNFPADDDDGKATVRITGDPENVQKARDAVETFIKKLKTFSAKMDAEAIVRLYGSLRHHSGREGSSSKFADLRDNSGITVLRKADSVELLGTSKDIDQWKASFLECVAEAGLAPLLVKLSVDQVWIWSTDRIEALVASSGAKINFMRKGRGEAVLEIVGTGDQKAKVGDEINKVNDELSWSEKIEEVPSSATRVLTAKGSGRLRAFEKRHNVSVYIDHRAQEVKIVGTRDSVMEARKDMESNIEAASTTVTETVEIKPEECGVIIGRNGSTVQHIRQTTGITELRVEGDDDTTKKVVIKGAPDAVKAAQDMVEEVRAKFKNPPVYQNRRGEEGGERWKPSRGEEGGERWKPSRGTRWIPVDKAASQSENGTAEASAAN